MTRIIAGLAKGKRLAVPSGNGTRPTSDRAREALFSTLQAQAGLDGASMLDLYAGSGAVGIEALSRGATRAVFVEYDAKALRTLRTNLAASGVDGGVVLPGKVARQLEAGPANVGGGNFDIAFLDPPYDVPSAALQPILELLIEHWLTADALIVLERATRDPEWSWPEGVEALFDRRYGEATLWYARVGGPAQ